MRKQLIALVLLLLMCPFIAPAYAEEAAETAEAPKSFSDVAESHRAYTAIMYLAGQGVLNGKSETEFFPEDGLKREEFAKILTAAFSLTDTKNAPVFYDVPAGTWYAPYVQTASATGLMNGISDRDFGTGYVLSRQDLALILKRFLDRESMSLPAENTVVYADSAEVADYAREAVELLASAGIMAPRDNNLWCPQAPATRAETAEALYQAVTLQKKIADSLGRMGDVSQYDGPYDVPKDDRVAEAMPVPFDANIWPREEIVYEDFEDSNFGILKEGYIPTAITFASEGGYESNGCLVLKASGTGAINGNLTWQADSSELKAGDYLVFSGMVKGEGMSGDGNYRTRLSIYDDKNKWLDETHAFKLKTDTDWTEYQQILMVPEGVNELTSPEFYNVNLNAYSLDMSGTVYFDDFRLFKIKFEPMNTVLMTPNYKGIIKGEDGVGDISLRAYIDNLNGMWDLSTFKYTAQITDADHNVLLKSESENVSPVMDIYFSSATLPMGGDYYLESILTDKETGEEVQKFDWPLHKREADFETTMGIDEYGRVTRNGEPYFPVSVYNWSNYDGVTTDIGDSEGIDNLQHSGMGWYYNFGTNETYRNTIETLGEKGKTVSLATGSMNFSNMYTGEVSSRVKEQSDLRGLLTKIVNNFKDLPNLFGYYTFDEQNAVRYGNELAWTRKIIESLDLNHPTTCAIDHSLPYRRGVYAKTADFLGYDPYPVTGKEDQDIALVYERIAEGRELNPNRPVYAILQGFWYDVRGDLRGPTKEEFRNMAFQAICAGSVMLDCYGYRAVMTTPSPGRTAEEEWNDFDSVFTEVQYLEPIILSALPAPYYEVKGGGEWLNTMSKRHDGKSYLFTVNNEPSAKDAVIYLDGVKEIRGMYTDRVIEANEEGWFEIEFDGYEVEVFEYEQADYKSSHAELTRFGLVDVLTSNAEDEAPVFLIPEGVTEAEYSAAISDFATLYINGEAVEKTGTLQLTDLSEITVKVVSEDGRFTTEKTFKIERS